MGLVRGYIDVQQEKTVFAYDFAVYALRHIRTHFWQLRLFEFQYNCTRNTFHTETPRGFNFSYFTKVKELILLCKMHC